MMAGQSRSEIGEFIMQKFSNFIEEENKKIFAEFGYEKRNAFKPKKATQAKLIELLEGSLGKEIHKTTFSSYINGASTLPLEMVLAISDTLNLKAEDFLKFIDLYVEQDTGLSRLLLPVEENDLAMNKCAKEVNQTIKRAFALKLLYEKFEEQFPDYNNDKIIDNYTIPNEIITSISDISRIIVRNTSKIAEKFNALNKVKSFRYPFTTCDV